MYFGIQTGSGSTRSSYLYLATLVRPGITFLRIRATTGIFILHCDRFSFVLMLYTTVEFFITQDINGLYTDCHSRVAFWIGSSVKVEFSIYDKGVKILFWTFNM